MSQYVTLLKTIRKDNNGDTIILDRRYMNVEIIMSAQRGSALILLNSTQFYVAEIVQDLTERRVILVEYDDLSHRDFRDDDFYPKYLKKLKDEGWMDDKPKSCLPPKF